MQRRRNTTFCSVGLVAAAVVGIAALCSTREGTVIYSSSLWSQKEMFSGNVPNAIVPAVLSDVGDTLKLQVYNDDYEKSPASLGIYYKWSYNLEPGRNNHLEISPEDSSRCVFVSLFTCTFVFSSRWLPPLWSFPIIWIAILFASHFLYSPHKTQKNNSTHSSGSASSGSTYTWYVLDNDGSSRILEGLHGQTGQTLSFRPSLGDSGRVFGLAVVRTKTSSGKVLSSQRFTVSCKYVRREFRELCDKDRTSYFDALSTIYHTTTEAGVALYGKKFRGSDYFIKKHLGATTLEGCTPWHDSEVFVTSHAAFNLELEGSLRSIDDSLSAHYWEITVDSKRYDRNWATQSPIFSAEMFGSYDWDTTDDHSFIKDGRFTDVNFYRCGDGDSIDDTCPEHSIYGYMIDANSYQAGGRLERSASICGIPTASKLPGCLFAERALKSKNLKHFWKNVELRYHGDQHVIIGGVTGCKFAIEEELSGFDKDSTVMRYAEDIMVYMGQWDRTLFSYDGFDLGDYSGTVKCPHSVEDCADNTVDCTCTLPTVLKAIEDGDFDLEYAVNVLSETGLYEDIAGAAGFAASYDVDDADGDDVSMTNWEKAFHDISREETEALLLYIAKAAVYQARTLNAYSNSFGSVNDPIFWAGHNSWERMWHYKRLELATESEQKHLWWNSWNETNLLNSSSAITCSWSSSADSTLPFYNLMKDDATTGQYYTNKDMLRMFHPHNKALPHIYDSLEYNHCSENEAEDEDFKHSEFRSKLSSKLRKRMAQQYGAKVKKGYSEEEATKLNKYYDAIFDERSLSNRDSRPIYEAARSR